MARSGTTLREVGTTNRTHLSDYAHAVGASTGAIVKVHRSNFEQRGFVSQAAVADLVPLARERNVPLLHDFGSGLMVDLTPYGLTGEPTARDAVGEGADLVVMSGDKLLGGPQAGIMLGRADIVDRCRNNPLTRAFRVDKLTLAALEATLRLYRDASVAMERVPVLRMLTAPVYELRARAERAQAALRERGLPVSIVETEATVGGGAFPSARIASVALALPAKHESPLRRGHLPVIGRVTDDTVLLDLRSVPALEDVSLVQAIADALAA
jgi:L-seryl-tRNA(Ser) seleniumtransferase